MREGVAALALHVNEGRDGLWVFRRDPPEPGFVRRCRGPAGAQRLLETVLLPLAIMIGGCGQVEQPAWLRTAAVVEVRLPTDADRARFLRMLSNEAVAAGYHVDAASPNDLRRVYDKTLYATVWRGEDEEPIASAMDFQGHAGRVHLSFNIGTDPARSRSFQKRVIARVRQAWPNTASVPILPTGGTPLIEHMVRTPDGYVIAPEHAATYAAGR